MTTATRKKANHHRASYVKKLPRSVSKQLEKIYSQSQRKIKNHPYKTATGVLVSLGLASGVYYLVRYFVNK
jgi:hypothetical protein